jgi:glutathione peroxidase
VELSQKLLSLLSGSKAAPASSDCLPTFKYKAPEIPGLCYFWAMTSEFYELSSNTPQGNVVSMGDFKGKVVLVVDTATQCGLTPQFEGLERLHQMYKDKGLVVLGFPCNQFGHQEPLSNDVMEETCKVNHGVSFPLFAKTDVNGPATNPVFKYLKSRLGGFFGSRIKWNFTKFLINAEGKPVKRFAPVTKPEAMEERIRELLGVQ